MRRSSLLPVALGATVLVGALSFGAVAAFASPLPEQVTEVSGIAPLIVPPGYRPPDFAAPSSRERLSASGLIVVNVHDAATVTNGGALPARGSNTGGDDPSTAQGDPASSHSGGGAGNSDHSGGSDNSGASDNSGNSGPNTASDDAAANDKAGSAKATADQAAKDAAARGAAATDKAVTDKAVKDALAKVKAAKDKAAKDAAAKDKAAKDKAGNGNSGSNGNGSGGDN